MRAALLGLVVRGGFAKARERLFFEKEKKRMHPETDMKIEKWQSFAPIREAELYPQWFVKCKCRYCGAAKEEIDWRKRRRAN